MLIRDLQRMELPDRLSDITTAPSQIYAATNQVVIDNQGDVVNTRDQKNQRRIMSVSWYSPNATYLIGGDNIPSRLAAYRNRMPVGLTLNSPEALANQEPSVSSSWRPLSEAACSGSHPPVNIVTPTTTDCLRFSMGGEPTGFIRWPVGY